MLLEALRIQGEGNCATVERFANYLKARVPQVTQRYKKYNQIPYVKIEPETKLHYILLPKFANLTDIASLRENALEAENEGDYDLAFQLWLRVNVAAGGSDIKAVNAFRRLANKQSPVELLSAKGIDYRELEKLLKEKEWLKADGLTARIMLKVANREKEGWLNEDSVKIFPCIDLQTIDKLWVHYSDGKFGFSVQKNWLEVVKNAASMSWRMNKYSYKFGQKYEDYVQNLINDIYQMPLMRHGGYVTGLIFRPCAVFLSKRLLDCNR